MGLQRGYACVNFDVGKPNIFQHMSHLTMSGRQAMTLGSSEAVHFSQAFTALTVIFVYYEQYIEEENVSYQTKYYVVKVCNIIFLKIDITGNYGASLTEDFMMTPQLGDFAKRFLPLINEQNILL